uniref:MADF domain-containing protein n=1 Tax=Nothobranchius pienaari TaxID=704102 RepID=A0A1A8LKB3_9TELE
MKEKLILAVTDFPELYNISTKEHRDIHTKAAAWEIVGARINTSGEKAKKRWKNLRDTYMRVRKSLKERKSGSAAGGQKTWKYYQIMSFLEPHLKERVTSGNLTADDLEQEEEIISTLEPALEEEDCSSVFSHNPDMVSDTSSPSSLDQSFQQPSSIQQTHQSARGKRKRPADSFEATILNRLDDIQAQLKQGDEDELYLQSLLPTFRRLTGARKSMAKVEIMKVLHKIEFGEE